MRKQSIALAIGLAASLGLSQLPVNAANGSRPATNAANVPAEAIAANIATPAASSDNHQNQSDVIFNALGDEMDRSTKELKLGHHQAPYFVRYTVYEADELDVSSALGAPPNIDKFRVRYLDPDLRVGSYEQDNTNFLPTESRHQEWVDVNSQPTMITLPSRRSHSGSRATKRTKAL